MPAERTFFPTRDSENDCLLETVVEEGIEELF
jgi:hypothetical protein